MMRQFLHDAMVLTQGILFSAMFGWSLINGDGTQAALWAIAFAIVDRPN